MTLLRRRFLQFLGSIAALHVTAIAIYYLLDIPAAAPARQRQFAWVWMGLTVALVVVGIQRIKRARLHDRARR